VGTSQLRSERVDADGELSSKIGMWVSPPVGKPDLRRISSTGRAEGRRAALTWMGLVVALGFPSLPVAKWVDQFAGIGHLVGYEVIWWAVVGFLLAYVRIVERRPLSSLGFRALTRADFVVAIAAALAMVVGLATIYFVLFPRLGINENSQIAVLFTTPLWWRIVSVIRAAVGEEVLFRGYAIDRLEGFTGNRGVAAAVSCAVFAAAHVGPWGWAHLFIAGFGGVMLTALYLWRWNLWVNIIAHAIVDGVAVVSG
jgi:uncharacterized protein